ncbi:putative x-pro dipeptidyl-peptidase protein [Phaeoacremonium minimum UCRPA7]|uniref:Putative x-pro dipeptidyl-peptidase protein n=1 Tax=Phaeoacremonium minimum (strain UCR-PA7) TaxID=1286976 RepID=R8BLJ6_PHAM7|nr:putative x-pro dipeptidyl-peptidase protein [Phaeoacremonium minimum UCRPA7]EOO00212.1 putative x-pro dipeptidyl-peptidase protein [Phaeoacremonium minimum UCRPA7]
MSLKLQDIYHQEEVEGYIFEKNVTVPRETGEAAGNVLRVNVYRPPIPGKYPVIVTFGPYGKDWHYSTFAAPSYAAISESQKSIHSSWETPSPKYWTAHGYVVVRADEGGLGQSPGKMNVLSKQTVDGFFDVIQWAAEQPWSSGKVGLLGLSYYAATQWMVAARHPKGLEAMIPWEGFSDVYRDCARHGGIASNGFLEWWWNNSLRGNQYGYPTPEEKPGRPNTEEGKLTPEELAENRVVIYDAIAENEFADQDFNSEREFKLADITTPFLSVANWGGVALHLRGNVRAFMFASAPLKYIRFIVGRHDLPFYYDEEVENQRSFLDAFLKGQDTKGWTIPGKIPPVDLVVRKGEPAVANVAEEQKVFQRRAEWEWPLARTEYRKWFLSSTGELATTQSVTEQKVFEYAAPE